MRLAGGRATNVGLAQHRRQERDVDSVGARDEADDRLQPARPGSNEDQRLHDLTRLRPDRRGGVLGRVGRLVEDVDVELDSLASRSRANAIDRGVLGTGRHGRSLASGLDSSGGRRTGSRPSAG